MIEFYPQIKTVHITAVMASSLLFLVRGAQCNSVLSGRWQRPCAT
jgi:hypothetical protein